MALTAQQAIDKLNTTPDSYKSLNSLRELVGGISATGTGDKTQISAALIKLIIIDKTLDDFFSVEVQL